MSKGTSQGPEQGYLLALLVTAFCMINAHLERLFYQNGHVRYVPDLRDREESLQSPPAMIYPLLSFDSQHYPTIQRQALEKASQGCGRVTVHGSVQKTCR